MATIRPAAVATSAAAIPCDTTLNPPVPATDMDWNALRMPTTVPKRPTNGAEEPTVPSAHRYRLSESTVALRCEPTASVVLCGIFWYVCRPRSNTSASGTCDISESAAAFPRSPFSMASTTRSLKASDLGTRFQSAYRRSQMTASPASDQASNSDRINHSSRTRLRIVSHDMSFQG